MGGEYDSISFPPVETPHGCNASCTGLPSLRGQYEAPIAILAYRHVNIGVDGDGTIRPADQGGTARDWKRAQRHDRQFTPELVRDRAWVRSEPGSLPLNGAE